jgi:hypothetical protein
VAKVRGEDWGWTRCVEAYTKVSCPIAKAKGLQLEAASGPTDGGPSVSAFKYA